MFGWFFGSFIWSLKTSKDFEHFLFIFFISHSWTFYTSSCPIKFFCYLINISTMNAFLFFKFCWLQYFYTHHRTVCHFKNSFSFSSRVTFYCPRESFSVFFSWNFSTSTAIFHFIDDGIILFIMYIINWIDDYSGDSDFILIYI